MFFNRLVEAPGVLVLILRSLLALARGRRGLALSILPPAVTAALLAATVLALSATPVRAQDSTPTVVPEISLNAKFRGYNPFNWPGGGVFWAGDDVVVILTRCDPATGDCSGFLAPELAVTLEVVTQDPLTDADTERRDVSVTFAADEYTAEARVPTTAATEPRARYWLKVNLREAAGYTINAREQVLSGELHAPFPQTVSITADADTVSEGEDAQFTLKRCVHPIIGIDHIARSACFDEGLPDLTVDVTVTGEGQTIDGTPPAQVTFAAGSATASLAVPTATDDLDEDTLAVTAAIAAPGAGNNAYELGVPASAAVQVANTPPVLPEISLKAKFGGYDTISWSGGDVFWAGDDVLLTLTRCDPTTGECSGFLAPELAVTLEVVTQDLLTDAVTERRDVSVTFAADEYTAEARVPTTAATEPRARYWLKVILQEAAGYTINARKQGMSGEVHAPFPQTVSITADADTVSEGEDARFTLKRCVHPILGIDLINRSACFDQGLPDLTVDVTVTGEGQTIDGTPPAQVTFAAGSATASLTMPTATDDLYEDTLAVTAAIAAPGAGNNAYELGDPANAAVQVANTTPLPTISSNPAAGNEADGAIEFHVSLSPVSAVPATLAYATSDATAKAGEDYTAAAGTLTFEPGVTSQTIRVEVTEDYLHEPDETFYITLSNPRGAQHIYEAFQGRIRANPVSTVTITGPEAVVEGETVTVTLTRTQTQGGLDVNLGYTNGSDAQFSGTPPATARFEHGRSETTATFATVDNPRLLPIGEENSVLVGLNRGDGYTVGSAGQEFLFITVTDNDVPAVSIETAAGYSPSGWTKYPVIWAGDDAVFTLKRCDPSTGECGGFVAPALTVNLLRRIVTGTNQVEVQDASQTATFDAGAYTVEVRVPTAEAEQTGFQSEQIMSVKSGAGYNSLPGSRSVSLEVHAPYPQRVSIAPAVAQVNEGEIVDFTLTRCAHPNDEAVCFDEGLPALTVPVSVTDEGKVLSGTPPAQVTFAAGSATASLTMPTATDYLYEETLAVTAAIAAPGAGNNAYELGAPSSAAVKVANTTPLPTISATSAGASEEDGAIEFAVSLSPPSGVTAKVHYRIADGTATAGEDYTAVGGTLTFEPGDTGKTVRVEIAADYETEGAETFTLLLFNPQHARLEGGETILYATGTIQAEAAPTLSLTLTNQAPPGASEPTIIPGQPLQWRLVRQGDASAELAVVLRYRVRAARVSGQVGEWTEGSIRQTFPADQTSIDGSATVNAEGLGWDGEIDGNGAIRIATPEETSNEIGQRILYRIDPDASSGSFRIEHETPMVVVENRQDEVQAGEEAEFQLVRFGEFDNALTATVEFSGAFAGPARRDVVFPPGTEIVRFKLWSRLPATDSVETSITASLAESTAYRTTTGGIEGDSNFRRSQIPVVDNGLPIVFIETDNDFAFEGSPVVFLLTRQAASYSTPLTVSVTVTDLRGSLVDEPPTEVRFVANSRRATLRLNTGSDSLVGMSDHVTATLNAGSGYRIPAPGGSLLRARGVGHGAGQ